MVQTEEQKKILFRMSMVGGVLLILLEIFVFFVIEKNIKAFLFYNGGLFISLVLGHYVTKEFVCGLKKYFNMTSGGDNAATKWLGHFERFAIASSIVLNRFGFIPFWLAFKVIGRWAGGVSEEQGKSAIDIFFLGNLISILFGILGGLIISERCIEIAYVVQ